MSDAIITVSNLGKCYRISHQADRPRYTALRDVLASKAKGLFQNRKSEIGNRKSEEDFWALRDVSFEVKRGEVVGVIGRNGAGKSTLLKILSRITEPTEGEVRLKGRVASLLEVGTGFHPELTGRENVFLNGAILGMSRLEIKRKFDEIVAFAEIDKFLDTPVKRYSSGMYVRLAFAVAAHLEPEILIVDEVLAVGDAEFQKKCLGKMQDVAGHGRTVLFVSHNMGMVQALCHGGVLLEGGLVFMTGKINQIIKTYLLRLTRLSSIKISDRTDRRGSGLARLLEVRISSTTGSHTLITGQAARFEFEASNPIPRMTCRFTLYNQGGQALVHFNSANPSPQDTPVAADSRLYVCVVDTLLLLPGIYWLNVALEADREALDHLEAAAIFEVEAGSVAGRLQWERAANCDVCMVHRWAYPRS